jgi:S-adenosylmethionine decarboxylase
MTYNPGLHILLTVRTDSSQKLKAVGDWLVLVDAQIKEYGLQSLGHIQHSFLDSGGYTAVHCLTESHISIHTWPEFNLCTCDVFLSNFKRDNSAVVKQISQSILQYFNSSDYDLQEISR